jgi:hypothetical protein
VRNFTTAVVTAALIGTFASAATAATWDDGVTQAPSSLGLTADGSYAYTHLGWGQLNTADAGSRTADGDIYQRVCWAACLRWRVTGHVTLTLAGRSQRSLRDSCHVGGISIDARPGSTPRVRTTPRSSARAPASHSSIYTSLAAVPTLSA